MKRRILTSVVVAVVVAVVGGLAASWSFVRAGATVFRITKTAAGSSQWTPDKPMFVLLLGSDLRPGAGCGCNDAIHVVGIPAGGGQATFINVPRDSRIDVPGHGLMKLTEAMSVGGEQLTTQAISEWMGLPITYTIVTTFDGLAGMVDELGGVTVNVPERIDDSFTQVHLDPGPVPMDGDLALRFARSRHINGGDYDRTQNQALLILSALGEVRAAGTSPADTVRYLGILARHTTLNGMSTADLYRLARVAMAIDPANVKSVLVPSNGALIGGRRT
ncbi:MAG TPA: LCP family protein [Acidimicrobiales bacterium]|nr:LCP family protein [Acidimicrobiales bacterium]